MGLIRKMKVKKKNLYSIYLANNSEKVYLKDFIEKSLHMVTHYNLNKILYIKVNFIKIDCKCNFESFLN